MLITTTCTADTDEEDDMLYALGDMRLRVSQLELDPVEHKDLYDHYTAISGQTTFPQLFVEDAYVGTNCVFISSADLEVSNTVLDWLASCVLKMDLLTYFCV